MSRVHEKYPENIYGTKRVDQISVGYLDINLKLPHHDKTMISQIPCFLIKTDVDGYMFLYYQIFNFRISN